ALVARRKRYLDGVTSEITTKWFSLYFHREDTELQSCIQAITSLGSCGCIRNMDNAREIGRENYFSRVERRILASIRQQRVNALNARHNDINRFDLSYVNVYKFPAIVHSVAHIAH
ncbi:hypothetical protein ALC53_08557, partial [Atta colombica]